MTSSGDKNISFRCIILTKEVFFRKSDTCHLLIKDELVYENPLKRSVLKSQFQNPRNMDEKDWFFHTIHKKQLIHDGIKNRLHTLSHRLLGGSSEVPTKYYVKIKMIWGCILSHNPNEKNNHCVVWCPLHRLIVV